MPGVLDRKLPKVDLPTGKAGPWEIKKFEITKKDRLMSIIGYGGRAPSEGWFTGLYQHGDVIMSDTDAERWDHYQAYEKAVGKVLVMGLGLGMFQNACLLKPGVQHVLTIEKDANVIALVAPHYKKKFGKRFEVINADALEWKPPKGARWGMVWHDIWPAITSDNLPDMRLLCRRFGRHADWQGCWGRELIYAQNRQERRWFG